MTPYIEKVKDYPDLVRVDSSYIINTNHERYQSALVRKRNAKRIQDLEQKVETMSNDIKQILTILQGLTN